MINREFFNYFKSFLGKQTTLAPFALPFDFLGKLDQNQREALLTPFTLQKIEIALSLMDANKAPRPDGFNTGVLRALWNTIKEDYFNFSSNFFCSGRIPAGFNSSFIALIPKCQAASSPTDF